MWGKKKDNKKTMKGKRHISTKDKKMQGGEKV